jgi:hypothetical protein
VSERIYAVLDDDFIRRMRNWARAQDGTPIPTAGVDYVDDRYREAKMPVLFGEALDTGRALLSLPADHRSAVEQFWLYEYRSLRWHAKRLAVSYHTFEVWVVAGHIELQAALRRRR